MVTVEECNDAVVVKYVIFSIWDEVAPTGADPNEFDPDMDNSIWLEIWDNATFLGVYKIHGYGPESIMMHANVLPEHRRKYTDEITKEVVRWMKDNLDTDIKRVVVSIPKNKPNVLKYVRNIGFEEQDYILGMDLQDMYSKWS